MEGNTVGFNEISLDPVDDQKEEQELDRRISRLLATREVSESHDSSGESTFGTAEEGNQKDDYQVLETNPKLVTAEDTASHSPVEELVNVDSNQQGKLPGRFVYILEGSSKVFKVRVQVNNVSMLAILDTGAACSLISSQVVEQHKFVVSDHFQELDAIGDNEFHTHGRISGSIKVGNVDMGTTDLIVFPHTLNDKISLLLGVDFLKANNLEIRIRDRILSRSYKNCSKTHIHLDDDGEILKVLCNNVPVYLTNAIKLVPGSVHKVNVRLDSADLDDSSMLVYTDSGLDSNLSDGVRGYTGITDKRSKHIFMVASVESVTLKEGEKVGIVNSVLEIDDEDKPGETADVWEGHVHLSQLESLEQTKVFDMLGRHQKVFSTNENDIGLAGVTSHNIKITDDTPIYQRPRRFPQPITDEIEKQCRELTIADIIEPSTSPWSAPVVPVRKKDGTIRLCVDYRKLNAVTVPDKFPVPNLSDSIFGLSGTKFFTCLDLIRGYYQIPLDEASRQYTAFSTSRNHWQFKRLSFGLRNAPSAFQREIQAVLSAFPSNKVIAYIDDILIMSSSFDEHLDLVSKVLQTLEDYNLKIKASKCKWFQSEVGFLGHIVSSSGVRKTPEYVDRVTNYPRPKTVGELREFLGLINFQRKYIPNCSSIQKPLTSLTGAQKSKALEWTDEMLDAFDKLKTEMKAELELGYPDYSDDASKLELYVDASNIGAGAYLAQQQDENHRIIGFASMTFTNAQLHYCTLDRELAALRWGIKTFKPFLFGVEFVLYTDHQPLVHLHNMKLVSSRLTRTVQELADYIFDIRYIPGKLNCAADALSRLNYKVPDCVSPNQSYEVPTGLTLDGPPSPGGGDSLFISLHKVLKTLDVSRLPPSVDELRTQLVEDLVNQPNKYQIKGL